MINLQGQILESFCCRETLENVAWHCISPVSSKAHTPRPKEKTGRMTKNDKEWHRKSTQKTKISEPSESNMTKASTISPAMSRHRPSAFQIWGCDGVHGVDGVDVEHSVWDVEGQRSFCLAFAPDYDHENLLLRWWHWIVGSPQWQLDGQILTVAVCRTYQNHRNLSSKSTVCNLSFGWWIERIQVWVEMWQIDTNWAYSPSELV